MSNWYVERKEADLKQRIKNIAKPAVPIGVGLGLGLGLMGNPKTPMVQPTQQKQVQPSTQQATQPTTAPITAPATQPATQPTTQKAKPSASRIVEMLKDHEGFSLSMYPDSENIPTIGIGFNLTKSGAKEKIEALGYNYEAVVDGTQSISNGAATKLFNDDLATAKADISSVVPDLNSHPQAVQDVLTDMMFNMGINRFSGFKNMIAAVNAKDYQKAADEMINSKWYGQVARRGPALEKMMRGVATSTQPTK